MPETLTLKTQKKDNDIDTEDDVILKVFVLKKASSFRQPKKSRRMRSAFRPFFSDKHHLPVQISRHFPDQTNES